MMQVIHWMAEPEWRIVESGLGAELQTWGWREWITMYEAPERRYCVRAYELLRDGETPPCWEEMIDDDDR